ncbi:unnamed protein product, partial [marine sediment metagenome]
KLYQVKTYISNNENDFSNENNKQDQRSPLG